MKDLRPDQAPSDAKANIAHQDRVFTRKAFRLEELFDYGETFNDVTLNVSTYYHYRKIFDVIVGSPRAAVLELGCHTGKNLRYIAEKNPGVKTFGLDISFLSLLKACTNNVHGTGFLSGSAERLPFKEGCVDAVLCMDLLEHLSDPAACLAEASRVLRRGGKIAIKCPVKDIRWTADAFRRWRDPEGWRKTLFEIGHAEERLLRSGELVGLLEEAGFRIVQKIHFDVFVQNLYDYWFMPTFLPKIKSWFRIRSTGGGPPREAPPAPSSSAAPEEIFEIPADPAEVRAIRSQLRRRIAIKRWIARFVLPAVRLLSAPERLLSRLGIGATIYVIGEKIGEGGG
ncbi:MAG: methyltransferase domain-containing protein [bacterium]